MQQLYQTIAFKYTILLAPCLAYLQVVTFHQQNMENELPYY